MGVTWEIEDTILGAALGAWLSVADAIWLSTWMGAATVFYCLALAFFMRIIRDDWMLLVKVLTWLLLGAATAILGLVLANWTNLPASKISALFIIVAGWPVVGVLRLLYGLLAKTQKAPPVAQKEGAA